MPSLAAYLALDAVSAGLSLLIVGSFFRLWLRSRDSLHSLYATGFLIIGASFLSSAASEFNLAGPPLTVDAVQVSGPLVGAIVLLLAYVSFRRHGRARFWIVLAWTVSAVGLVFAFLYVVVPPFATLPDLGTYLPIAHAITFLVLLGCAGLSTRGFAKRPTVDRTLVPIGFLCLSLTKYTWLLFDLSRSEALPPFVYVWRLLGIAMFLLPIYLPTEWKGKFLASP